MEILGNSISPFQIFLIISLLVVGILGPLNQRRIKKAKLEEEELLGKYDESEEKGNLDLNDEESQQIRNYISSYKNQYSRESIKSALLNNGNSSEKIEKLLDEYY